MRLKDVSQVCNLPYRRFLTCQAITSINAPGSINARQVANLRYGRLKTCATVAILSILLLPILAQAHHFKGLPHYNYFENYPQVPEEEFLGQAGEYECSLVVYDFQGINRENVVTPDKVRLFLVIFNLLDNKVYQGPLTLEILDRGEPTYAQRFERAEQENIYSLHRDLPNDGRYALRLTLHDEGNLICEIPFVLSTQKVHWGKWIGAILLILIGIAAVGARKARIAQDRQETHRRAQKAATTDQAKAREKTREEEVTPCG